MDTPEKVKSFFWVDTLSICNEESNEPLVQIEDGKYNEKFLETLIERYNTHAALTNENTDLKGKVEKMEKLLVSINKCFDDNGDKREVVLDGSIWKFELAQQEPKEWVKVGEWVKKENGYIGVVTDISIHTLTVDPQDGINEDYMGMVEAIKPTQSEIQAHLTKIAEKRYPVGTKVKDGNDKIHTIGVSDFDYDVKENALFGRCIEFEGWLRLWDIDGWAEIIKKM